MSSEPLPDVSDNLKKIIHKSGDGKLTGAQMNEVLKELHLLHEIYKRKKHYFVQDIESIIIELQEAQNNLNRIKVGVGGGVGVVALIITSVLAYNYYKKNKKSAT